LTSTAPAQESGSAVLAVLRNGNFLRLWLAQLVTQVGGNMVIYGLTVLIFEDTGSNSAVSLLLLTFLVPAVAFSAVAGVFVDRTDRRLVLIVTNLLRAAAFTAIFFAQDMIYVVYALNIFISTVTTFFGPAEAAMIPAIVRRDQLLAANGVFTLTLNAAFALGFALLGPLVVTVAGAPALILIVAALYLVAALFCVMLPASPPPLKSAGEGSGTAAVRHAFRLTVDQLAEGLQYIRDHRNIGWSLIYLGITASLIGVLGVLGPDFATEALGLAPKDFVVIVLPLGIGIVLGILMLNSYGRNLPRRRLIEFGLIALGILVATLSVAGPITRFLQGVDARASFIDLSSLISLLSVVIVIALFVGVSYAIVAIPAQTQLQEDLPEEVRGRVFGVLNMLVSVASFLPIIIVGPIADLVGTSSVLLVIGILVLLSGIASVLSHRGTTVPDAPAMRDDHVSAPVDPVALALHSDVALPDAGGRGNPGVEGPLADAARQAQGEAAMAAAAAAAASPPDSDPDGAPDPTEATEPAEGPGRRLRSVRMRVARRKDNTSAP
jgi:MFS family permease